MKEFVSFVIKEAKHIVRDKRTMLILFGMPVVLMLLFGYAITNDVRNVRLVVVTSSADHQTQRAIDRLAASEYFVVTGAAATPAEAERAIRGQRADLAIVFGPDFASKHSGVQFIVDGSDPNMAQQWTAYATQTLSVYVYNKASALDMGYASAMALMLMLVLLLVAIPYLRANFRDQEG